MLISCSLASNCMNFVLLIKKKFLNKIKDWHWLKKFYCCCILFSIGSSWTCVRQSVWKLLYPLLYHRTFYPYEEQFSLVFQRFPMEVSDPSNIILKALKSQNGLNLSNGYQNIPLRVLGWDRPLLINFQLDSQPTKLTLFIYLFIYL